MKKVKSPWIVDENINGLHGVTAVTAKYANGLTVKVCDCYGVLDSQREQRARLIAASPKLREVVQRLLAYLEEAHADEIASRHHGDGRRGCSYCDAMDEARAALKLAGEVVP